VNVIEKESLEAIATLAFSPSWSKSGTAVMGLIGKIPGVLAAIPHPGAVVTVAIFGGGRTEGA
jgi:hypothetical protein